MYSVPEESSRNTLMKFRHPIKAHFDIAFRRVLNAFVSTDRTEYIKTENLKLQHSSKTFSKAGF